jgi:hypothetical protein
MSKGKIEKIHLYALIKPYDINLALTFYPFETIGLVQLFVEDTIRKLKSTPYKIGRIEKKSNHAILLPQYKINEFLCENEEIIVYSLEYGLTKTKISGEKKIEDIDELYIGKKLKRKNENKTRKSSEDLSKKHIKTKKYSDDDNNEDDNDNKSNSSKSSKSSKSSNEEEKEDEEEEDEEEDKIKKKRKKSESNSDIQL